MGEIVPVFQFLAESALLVAIDLDVDRQDRAIESLITDHVEVEIAHLGAATSCGRSGEDQRQRVGVPRPLLDLLDDCHEIAAEVPAQRLLVIAETFAPDLIREENWKVPEAGSGRAQIAPTDHGHPASRSAISTW